MTESAVSVRAEPFIKVEDGIPKIHEFEKYYITLLLKEEIKSVEKDINELKEASNETKESCIDLEGAAKAVERTYLRDIKAVLERVEAMPTTRW